VNGRQAITFESKQSFDTISGKIIGRACKSRKFRLITDDSDFRSDKNLNGKSQIAARLECQQAG